MTTRLETRKIKTRIPARLALGGIAELLFGVRAEQTPLEDIAKPLTAEEA